MNIIYLHPTLCQLLNVPIPPWVQGVSLAPMLQNPSQKVRDKVYGEVNYHVSYEPQRCVRTKHYCYIRRYAPPGRLIRPNIDGGPSKDVWLAAHGNQSFTRAEELYDLLLNPTEHLNCALMPEYEDVAGEMRHALDQWMAQTEDSLRKGDIPLPKGAITIPAHCRNADRN